MINRLKDLSHDVYPLQTVQFHPEAHPGPAESEYIFDEFIEIVKANNRRVYCICLKTQRSIQYLVIGSGPIVIGQAAEFDYAGTQACMALKEDGYKVILVNDNPATIMTDHSFADQIYFEPLTVDVLEKIIAKENPDGLLGNIGGQTGLNLAFQLMKKEF